MSINQQGSNYTYSLEGDVLVLDTGHGQYNFKIEDIDVLNNASDIALLIINELRGIDEKNSSSRGDLSHYKRLLLATLNICEKYIKLEKKYDELDSLREGLLALKSNLKQAAGHEISSLHAKSFAKRVPVSARERERAALHTSASPPLQTGPMSPVSNIHEPGDMTGSNGEQDPLSSPVQNAFESLDPFKRKISSFQTDPPNPLRPKNPHGLVVQDSIGVHHTGREDDSLMRKKLDGTARSVTESSRQRGENGSSSSRLQDDKAVHSNKHEFNNLAAGKRERTMQMPSFRESHTGESLTVERKTERRAENATASSSSSPLSEGRRVHDKEGGLRVFAPQRREATLPDSLAKNIEKVSPVPAVDTNLRGNEERKEEKIKTEDANITHENGIQVSPEVEVVKSHDIPSASCTPLKLDKEGSVSSSMQESASLEKAVHETEVHEKLVAMHRNESETKSPEAEILSNHRASVASDPPIYIKSEEPEDKTCLNSPDSRLPEKADQEREVREKMVAVHRDEPGTRKHEAEILPGHMSPSIAVPQIYTKSEEKASFRSPDSCSLKSVDQGELLEKKPYFPHSAHEQLSSPQSQQEPSLQARAEVHVAETKIATSYDSQPRQEVPCSDSPSAAEETSLAERSPARREIHCQQFFSQSSSCVRREKEERESTIEKNEYQLPLISFLKNTSCVNEVDQDRIRSDAELLEKKLGYFGIKGEVMGIYPGPVITTYEYKPDPGIKISKILGLADDLALALSAYSIRIVAPIPGKDVMGIEIPNLKKSLVPFIDIVTSEDFKKSTSKIPICLGKDIIGNPVVVELDSMPHLLIAGATGTGKSVGLNAMITSILYKSTPQEVRFMMVDPKRIELSFYNDIPHLLTPVITDMNKANTALQWLVREMDRRYNLLAEHQVRNINQYNRKLQAAEIGQHDDQKEEQEHLPYIVVIIDELADLMMTASRDIELSLTRLAQMARAAGIHLILATQRPSVDVLTGIIKANFPTRISFQVSSKTDSRTIIDANGAETLLGNGDMLFVPPGTARLTRVHGTYLSEDELVNITSFIKAQQKPDYIFDVLTEQNSDLDDNGSDQDEYDEKYNEALDFVMTTRQASISSVQRALRVGYNRAARIIDLMEKNGIIGPSDGAKPRKVLV